MRFGPSARLLALAIGSESFAFIAPVSVHADAPVVDAPSVPQAPATPPGHTTRQAPTTPSPAASEWGSARTLGGHTFPFAMFVPTSFTATYFGMRAGGYLRTVPDDPSARGNRTLEDFGVGEAIDLGIRFHERVALQAGAYGLARLGTNVDSLLGSGGQFEYGGHVGLLAKLLRVDATGTQLAVRTSFGVQGAQHVGMGSFASGNTRIALTRSGSR
jgi:hypothetical protein